MTTVAAWLPPVRFNPLHPLLGRWLVIQSLFIWFRELFLLNSIANP
jgi:hypothetical protein